MLSKKSETPRTDPYVRRIRDGCLLNHEMVAADFARELERELAEAKAVNLRIAQEADQMRHQAVERLRFLRDHTYLDAEPPELRAQNERCYQTCVELLKILGYVSTDR